MNIGIPVIVDGIIHVIARGGREFRCELQTPEIFWEPVRLDDAVNMPICGRCISWIPYRTLLSIYTTGSFEIDLLRCSNVHRVSRAFYNVAGEYYEDKDRRKSTVASLDGSRGIGGIYYIDRHQPLGISNGIIYATINLYAT